MGRKSNYNKQELEQPSYVTPEKADDIIKKIETKLGTKPLSVKEIVDYLNAINVKKDNQKGRTYTSKTIIHYIESLCEKSDGLLKVSDFKKAPGNEKSPYKIKPEIQGLLLTLLDSGYFPSGVNDRKLGKRDILYQSLLRNIEMYMSESDKKVIKLHASYITAQLESDLAKRLTQILSALFNSLLHSDPIIRYQMMKYVLDELIRIEKRISTEDAVVGSKKIAYAQAVDQGREGKHQKAIFQAITLDDYLVKLLANRMHKEDYSEVNSNEIISYPALSLLKEIYNMEFKENSEIKKILDEIDKGISNNAKYKEIGTKAKQILDTNNEYEAFMYKALMSMCKSCYLASVVEQKEYERAVMFIESAIAKDKWGMLNELYQMGDTDEDGVLDEDEKEYL